MFRTLTLTLISMTAAPLLAFESKEVTAAFERHTFVDGDLELPYRLLAPIDVKEGKKYPLLLFLHGYGERGDDNERQLIHGGSLFASEAFRRRHLAYVVAPQCPDKYETGTLGVKPGEEQFRSWILGFDREASSKFNSEGNPTEQITAVRNLVEQLRSELPIDENRLYVSGLSMGGYATWDLITREPEFWAAAAPICGGGDIRQASRLIKLPIWCFHGSEDSVVPADRSREMVDAINAAGGKVIYTEYEGVNHDSWTPTFRSRHVWDWLFAQEKKFDSN